MSSKMSAISSSDRYEIILSFNDSGNINNDF